MIYQLKILYNQFLKYKAQLYISDNGTAKIYKYGSAAFSIPQVVEDFKNNIDVFDHKQKIKVNWGSSFDNLITMDSRWTFFERWCYKYGVWKDDRLRQQTD